MKTSQILCVALAAALAFTGWQLSSKSNDSSNGTSAQTDATNAAYDCIMTRASCRSFSDRRPDEAQIDSLLRAGMAAPTARNQQAWQLVVVTDRDILDSIAGGAGYMKMAAEAPMAIVACGDLAAAHDKAERYWTQDLSAVTENILLAAHSMGLGAVWCGVYPADDRVQHLSKLLELPDSIVPLSFIPIGYPKTPLTPKQKFDTDKVHYNGW